MSPRFRTVSRLKGTRYVANVIVLLEQEGVRRTICDMSLVIFHLVFSGFTFEGVDMGMAEKIIKYNIKRYPNGKQVLVRVLYDNLNSIS